LQQQAVEYRRAELPDVAAVAVSGWFDLALYSASLAADGVSIFSAMTAANMALMW
jgi:hypothetical protein